MINSLYFFYYILKAGEVPVLASKTGLQLRPAQKPTPDSQKANCRGPIYPIVCEFGVLLGQLCYCIGLHLF